VYYGQHLTNAMTPTENEKRQRNPEHAVLCFSLPRIMKRAITRRAKQRDMNVSTLLRDWLLPTLLDRDEQFAAEWQRRMSRIEY